MADIVVVGSYVQDLAFSAPQFPRIGETRLATFTTGPGGKGFNQAVAAHRQGVATTFIGAVGQDAFALELEAFIAAEHLPVLLEIHPGVHTGAAAILVNGEAQNLISVALGANDLLSREFVRSHRGLIARAKVLVTQLESNLSATEEALGMAAAAGVTTILNPAPINELLRWETLKHVRYLVPNESEFAFLSEHLLQKQLKNGAAALSDTEWSDVARDSGLPELVVTLGAQGAVFISRQGEVLRIPPVQVSPIDTTGAGDAFCGGLAAGLAKRDGNIADALRYATAVAGLSTERRGTAPAMPHRAEVESKLML